MSRKTEPHQKCDIRIPAHSGPTAAIAPPTPDHRAMARVLGAPAQSAVISASVVGYAMPAASPPNTRAAKSTVSLGANAASSDAGMARPVPSTSMSLRP